MYRDGRDSLILKKPVFDFSVRNQKKSGVCKKLKVSTMDIRIKQSGLKVSHSKVPISELGTWIPIMSISISTLEITQNLLDLLTLVIRNFFVFSLVLCKGIESLPQTLIF